MRKSLLTILFTSFATSAFANEQYWVHGVNEKTGWVDQDKAKNEYYNEYKYVENSGWQKVAPGDGNSGYFNNDRGTGDGFLCWAASATDILTWWHNQNPGAAQLNSTAEKTQEEIWKLFKDTYWNDSGSAAAGIEWYMDGTPTTEEPYPRVKPLQGGAYYSGMLVDSKYFDIRQFDPNYVETEEDIIYIPGYYQGPTVNVHLEIANKMSNLIDQGYIISLGIGDISGTKHAVTLWGLETDDDGYLTKMWITDSDDNLNGYGTGLIELACTQMVNEIMVTDTIKYGDQYAYGITSTGKTYEGTEFPEKEGLLWYEYNEEQKRNDYFYDFAAFKFSSVAYQGVPEPTTGTLSLLALAGLAARRRRKG